MLAQADHVRRHWWVNQTTLQFCFRLRGVSLLDRDHLVLSDGLGCFVLFVELMLVGFEDVPYHFGPIVTDWIVLADWWGFAALISALSLLSGLLFIEA